ncbi:MAG: N,N-dimethylformamidase beta subunit family domain-containing protein [Nocardioides sp.]
MKRWVLATALLSLLGGGCAGGAVRSGAVDPHAPQRTGTGVVDEDGDHDPDGPRRHRRPRGSEGWRLDRAARPGGIEAFTTRSSGAPGTPIGLKVSTRAADYRVQAYRIGWYRGGTGHRVWHSGSITGRLQGAARFAPYATRTLVAPWRRDVMIDTEGWAPGVYVLKLHARSGAETQVPYVVSSPSSRGRVALVAPVTTWQAYNRWGGYSLYDGPAGDRRAWAVSFNRPYHLAPGANDFRSALLPVVVLAEKTGVPLSYYTNVDLDARPGLLAGARGYLSVGHDEYWTPGMRAGVLEARAAGTNLGFLGANTMYWRVRLDQHGRRLVGYRHDAHIDPLRTSTPHAATSRFRDPPSATPENGLVGMLYECYPVDTDYRVVSPGWWGFRGTGVRDGSLIPGLVGPESDRVYPDRFTPRPLQILSHGTFDCRGVVTSTQSVYYSAKSGAGVFTAGTLRWGCALVDRCDRPLGRTTSRFVRIVTGNLLRAFATGPVGARHPARDNLRRFDLPLANSVSAS